MSERVAVVIVNANGGEHLETALEHLERQTLPPDRVIVVDNASTDGSTACIPRRFPSVELVEPGANLGFAAGNNLAIRLADDCGLVALLNPDAFPEPEWLETLVAAAGDHPEHAVFGSRLLSATDESRLDGTGDCYHRSGIAWRRDEATPSTTRRPAGETFSACAAAALYRRADIVAAGGFDESFFCYYEDTDLAYRLRLTGRTCLHVPGAVARHVGSATSGRLSAFTIYHSSRNQEWVWLKNTPLPMLLLALPSHVAAGLAAMVTYARLGVGRAALAGKRDALRELPRILRARRAVQAARTVPSREIGRAMSGTGDLWRATRAVRALSAAPPEPRREGAARLRHLDGLRGLAALFVVLHHAWLTVWPNMTARQLAPGARETVVLAFGHFAVVVFIVLSGFCLGLPVARTRTLPGGAAGFLRRRARRLLPPYYASVALSMLLVWTLVGHRTGTHWDLSVPVDAKGYLGSVFLLDDVLGGGQLNHVWWSVALEWQICLLFPLLAFVWLRRGAAAAAGAAGALAACALVAVTAVPQAGWFDLGGLRPWFLFLFALGLVGAELHTRGGALRDRLPWGALTALGVAAVATLCVVAGRTWVLVRHPAAADMLVGLVALAAVVASSRPQPSLLRRALSVPWACRLGTFAYSLYLIHAPLLQVGWQTVAEPVQSDPVAAFAALLLVVVPATVAAAYVFFLLFERPFLRPARAAPAETRVPLLAAPAPVRS